MVSWRKPFSSRSGADVATADSASQISDGSITYVGEKGGNNAGATYQEASGAPVESDSPLGYAVGPLTILGLNISMMIGTGIYSTRPRLPIAFNPGCKSLTNPSFRYIGWYRVCRPQLHLLDYRFFGMSSKLGPKVAKV